MPVFNSNGTSPSRKDQPDEKNAWQFRDQRTPARVCHLLRDGKVTPTDLLLLWTIDSLVRPHGEQAGIGSWASNAYLGRAVGKNPRYVSGCLHQLQEMGLILITWVEGRRYLECEWSRTAEERAALSGEYGKALRRAHAELVAETNQKYSGVQKDLKGGSERSEGGVQKDLNHNINELEGDKGKAPTPAKPSGVGPPEGKVRPDLSAVLGTDRECSDAARKLQDALRRNNRIARGTLDNSANHLRLLRDIDRQKDWLKVLRWYCEHCSREQEDELRLPHVENGKQFRARYDWIEGRWRKAVLASTNGKGEELPDERWPGADEINARFKNNGHAANGRAHK